MKGQENEESHAVDVTALLTGFLKYCFPEDRRPKLGKVLRKYEPVVAGSQFFLIERKVGKKVLGRLVDLAHESQKRLGLAANSRTDQVLDMEAYLTESQLCSDFVVQPFGHQPYKRFTFFMVSVPEQSPQNQHEGRVGRAFPITRESDRFHQCCYIQDHYS